MKPFLLFATNLRNNRGVSNRHVEILKTDFGTAPGYYRCFAVFPASKNTNLDYFRVYPPVSKWCFVSYPIFAKRGELLTPVQYWFFGFFSHI
jgi:hypothetical protein